MSPKVVIIGLDAATLTLVEKYARDGALPNMQRMMTGGATGLLLSTPNMHSASSWTSIITGKNPGKHGLFVFSDRTFATNQQAIFTGADRKCESLFRLLARAGLKAGMINVPMTYPAESAPGGFMISGLDAPSFDERAFSPKELRAEFTKLFPGYAPTPPQLPRLMEVQELDAAIDVWIELIRIRTEAAKYLMARYEPEFFMVVYTATDWVQHYFWKYIDARHPEYNEAEAARYSGTIRKFYQVMDGVIGQIQAAAGAEANIIIVSDHGMGCHTQGSFHIVEWLVKSGFLALKPAEASAKAAEPAPGFMQEIERGARQVAKSLLPASMRETIKSIVGEKSAPIASKDRFYGRVLWEQTTAYSEHGRNVININLKGRNKFGIVDPADYDRVCDELIAKIREWRDPDTGLPVVKAVKKRAEMYDGPYKDQASDMYVHWNPDVVLQRPVPDAILKKKFWWNGTHRPQGVIICEGPQIKSAVKTADACVYDIVPTVLNLLGIAKPEDLDGRVLNEILSEQASPASEYVEIEKAAGSNANDSVTELSEDEERDVAEKLRGLGYL
jgi:predicted AlkP superfamily phosphohydrolase/phosphomutase